jgi:hypothetical protein
MNLAYGMRDEQAAEGVRQIFAAAANGHTLTQIRDMMNRLGVRAPKGGEWTRSKVRRIIENERYCRSEPDIPALIDGSVWAEAQAIFMSRSGDR